MERIIFISVVFLLIAHAIGLVAYYSKRNQYSKSAQNIITILPAAGFVLLAFLGAGLWLLLAWWAEVEDLHGQLFAGQPPLWVQFGIYILGGAIVNLFLSVLVQLVVLMIHPPKYKTRRRRRRTDAAKVSLPDETPSLGG